jgi:hypothetical protein
VTLAATSGGNSLRMTLPMSSIASLTRST